MQNQSRVYLQRVMSEGELPANSVHLTCLLAQLFDFLLTGSQSFFFFFLKSLTPIICPPHPRAAYPPSTVQVLMCVLQTSYIPLGPHNLGIYKLYLEASSAWTFAEIQTAEGDMVFS